MLYANSFFMLILISLVIVHHSIEERIVVIIEQFLDVLDPNFSYYYSLNSKNPYTHLVE